MSGADDRLSRRRGQVFFRRMYLADLELTDVDLDFTRPVARRARRGLPGVDRRVRPDVRRDFTPAALDGLETVLRRRVVGSEEELHTPANRDFGDGAAWSCSSSPSSDLAGGRAYGGPPSLPSEVPHADVAGGGDAAGGRGRAARADGRAPGERGPAAGGGDTA
ncbi:MAG TPA: hypothetical protein VGN37_25390 [Actinocatenispora sp.]